MSVTVRAAAKINLHLGVGARPRRRLPPARHRLPGDRAVRRRHARRPPTEPHPGDPRRRLHRRRRRTRRARQHRAARGPAARASAPVGTATESFEIRKDIPVAGGMAGGSADAAAALLACDRLWELGTSDDVPARAGRRARQRRPVLPRGGYGAGRGPRRGRDTRSTTAARGGGSPSRPSVGLSTPEVYRHFDRLCPDAPAERAGAGRRCWPRWRPASRVRLARALHNDLQAPAIDLRPELGDLIDAGRGRGRAPRDRLRLRARPCVFLCDSADGAHARPSRACRGAGTTSYSSRTGRSPARTSCPD